MNQVVETTTMTSTSRVNSRNLTAIILIVLLTVLSGIGIIVAITLQNSQAPEDSLAWPAPVCEDGNCFCENGGAICGNASTCEAGRGCVTYAELGSRNCQQYINDVCNPTGSQCAGGGSVPVGGQACCEGLTQCPAQGNVCTGSCSGNIGGGTGSCPSGQWNLYECKGSCSTGGGCQTAYTGPGGSGIIEDQSGSTAYTFVNGGSPYTPTTTCYVRQADCIGTSGVNLVFRSSYSCSNQCTGGGTTGPGTGEPPTTGQPNPFCGDAICATNELCERTSPGGSSFRACRAGDIGSTPGGQVVNECYRLTDGTNQVAGTGPRCKFCGDGLFHPAEEQCDGTAPAGDGNDPTNCSTACNIRVRACLGADRSADTLAPGVGNKAIFTLRFQDERANNPYVPGVYMRVSSGLNDATIVGRDANATSSTKVGLMPTGGTSKVQNADLSYNYDYKFQWEAASPSGVAVPAGTYTIQFFNESNVELFADNTLCRSTITISEEQVENPLFTIVKLSTPVCESDNDSRIDYTVRVTNTGPVEGVIDFVRDTLDADVIAAGIVPTAIVPAYGVYASGQITWEGTVADRTYASQQAKDFTYSVTIPASLVSSFTATGIDNQVVVQYDTEDTDDNTDSFTLNTPITCGTTVVVIPVTGILDDGRFLILGALFVLTGIYVYRRQYVLEHSFETEIERKLSRKADEQD